MEKRRQASDAHSNGCIDDSVGNRAQGEEQKPDGGNGMTALPYGPVQVSQPQKRDCHPGNERPKSDYEITVHSIFIRAALFSCMARAWQERKSRPPASQSRPATTRDR